MNRVFDLEERTLNFSKKSLEFTKSLKLSTINTVLIPQFIRSSTSIGANYREANDALGKKDFIHRIRIARKEAKETIYWLELILETNPGNVGEIKVLLDECVQLRNILSAIINKMDIPL